MENHERLSTEEFINRFDAAESLQEVYRRRLRDQIDRQPAPADRPAIEAWLPVILKALTDYREWGQAFVRLIDSAPQDVLEQHPRILESRASVQKTIEDLDTQLDSLGLRNE